jgi:hypothetical protein
MMQVKRQSLDEIIEKRQKEFEATTEKRSDDAFILKENLEIKVIDHGDTYCDPIKTKDAVCCPECGEVVYLEDDECVTKKIGSDTSIIEGEERKYDLICDKCGCHFEATEVDKHVEISALIVYVPVILFIISLIMLFAFTGLGISLGEIICGLVCALSLIWLFTLAIICFIFD